MDERGPRSATEIQWSLFRDAASFLPAVYQGTKISQRHPVVAPEVERELASPQPCFGVLCGYALAAALRSRLARLRRSRRERSAIIQGLSGTFSTPKRRPSETSSDRTRMLQGVGRWPGLGKSFAHWADSKFAVATIGYLFRSKAALRNKIRSRSEWLIESVLDRKPSMSCKVEAEPARYP